ncbi:MAG: BlaI/MecI/CopY family transcriptional regulator [Acidimicrobiales bacterium]
MARRLGELESAVMKRLWAWDRPTSVREVFEDLHRHRSVAYTTVMTVMNNLHRKGVLTRETSGRAYIYRPARSREEHVGDLLEDALGESSDRTAALLGFVERLSSDQIKKLREALG